MERIQQSLNGWWDYRVGQGAYKKQKVPYSALPVGLSECRRSFDAVKTDGRAFLVFEGVTYQARATLNGRELGVMLPYSEYRFEITDLLTEKDNLVEVQIRDMGVAFGPAEGWENYGGIIRGVFVEYTDDSIIEDVFWHGALNGDYTEAICEIRSKLDVRQASLRFRAALVDKHGRTVGAGESEDGCVIFSLDHPALWSPDTPELYTLSCALIALDGEIVDAVSQKVGFKDFCKKGKRFYLNGEPIFLLGVDRHDLYGDSGHTQTEAEMRRDMRLIKDTGVNFVRLVHYPHNKRILELADELGLLVSEEPGLWWSDMHNPEVCQGALEVLRRVILRDRNHISVAFWLSFNECVFTPEFLRDSARVCREADPYRMVSGANCMSLEMTKEHFLPCGLDFYTMHPYGPTVDRLVQSAQTLTEMPLVLTEWGGHFVYDNKKLLREFIQTIIKLWRNDESEPVLAGAVFWYWAEMFEFHRGEPGCKDGVLHEGLMDRYRNPTEIYEVFREEFARLHLPDSEPEFRVTYGSQLPASGAYRPIPLTGLFREDAWQEMLSSAAHTALPFRGTFRKNYVLTHGPVLPEEIRALGEMPVELLKRPAVLSGAISIPVNERAEAICVIGNVSMPKGFPVDGEYGETAAEYVVCYEDGTKDVFPMKNGWDITTAVGLYGPSRIEPEAANSPRALRYGYDEDFEQYVVNFRWLKADESKTIRELRLISKNEAYSVLLYGITLKKGDPSL